MYLPGLRPGSMSWTIYQDFATSLRAAGVDFEMLTDAPTPIPQTDAITFLAIPTTRLDSLAAPLTRNHQFVATTLALAQWLRRAPRLDVLYVEMAYPWGAAAHLARRLSRWPGRLIIAPLGEDILTVAAASYGHRRYALPRWLVARTLGNAAAIRCISPMVAERVQRWSNRPTAVIPLNVAPSTVTAAQRPESQVRSEHREARAAVAQELGLERKGLVLSLGRLHPFKGIHLLVEAMTRVADAELLIVGPSVSAGAYGDYGDYLRALTARLGLNDRVRMLGAVPHNKVLRMMSAADVLVVPSILESMNRVCVEAAAAGTPFVVTSSTGVADYLSEEGVGLAVAPDDAAALATAMTRILSGSWRRDGAAAARLVNRFDTATIAPQVVRLFEAALDRSL